MINLDTMPPDWEFAQNHANSCKPGRVDMEIDKNGSYTICKCCLNPIRKQQIPLCSNSKQLEFLGFGFPLYFIFLKYSMILLLILICSYNAVAMYQAIRDNQSFCFRRRLAGSAESDPHCTSFLIKFAVIKDSVDTSQIIKRIASFVIHLGALLYIRDTIRKTISYYNERSTKLSDYSFMMKNLPLKQNIQKNIQNFIHYKFKQQWQKLKDQHIGQQFKKQEKVMQITLLPNLDDFYRLQKQKDKILQQKKKVIKKLYQQNVTEPYQQNNNKTQTLYNVNLKLYEKEKQIKKFCLDIRNLIEKDLLLSSTAIVSLNSQVFKNVIMQYAEKHNLNTKNVGEYFGQLKNNIIIEKVYQPKQILWQNVSCQPKKHYIGIVLGWIFSAIFIACATIGFYFILVAKSNNLLEAIDHVKTNDQLKRQSKYVIAVFLVFFLLFLIVSFNKLVMGWALHKFTHFQKHANTSNQQFSFALKYLIGLFFTTALMTLAVQAITFHNFFYHQYGVIQEESIMFFINSFFVPLIWLVNPWHIYTLISRYFKKDKPYYTQRQANQVMEDTTYFMGKRYAQILKTLWFTYLYATSIPLGAFISLLGLVLYYWIDKYNLLRKSSLPNNISGEMAIYSLTLLDFTLILKPIGTMIFDSQIRDGIHAQSIVLTCIAFVYLILPVNKLLQYFHPQKFLVQKKSYQHINELFLQTYQTLHPILNFKTSIVFQKMRRKVSKRIIMTEMSSKKLENSNQKKRVNQSQNDVRQFILPQTLNQLPQTINQIIQTNDQIPQSTSNNQLDDHSASNISKGRI